MRESGMASDAEVTAVELHPKRPGMYRVWVRVHGSIGTALANTDDEVRPAAGNNRREQQESPEDWHAEVDAWLQDAADVAASASDAADDANCDTNEYTVAVHEDTLVSMRLLKGRRLSPEEWQQLRQEEALEEAYRAALAIVERKARTSRELADALKRKGYSPEAIAGCMQRMQSRRLLDDSAYARRFAEQRTTSQRKGRHLVRQELVQRGISREEADRALGELDEQLEMEAALALARKKWPQLKGESKERRMKLTAFLLRRGFPSGIVKTALSRVQAESAADEEDGFA